MCSSPWMTRRRLLAGMAALTALPLPSARAAELRVATIDWAVLETLLALEVTPVAAAELTLFRRVAVEPAVPAEVADIGLRGTPNYEALRFARPDLIFSSNFYTWAEPKLRLVAPVESLSVYGGEHPPFAMAEQLALTLGERTGRLPAARDLIAAARGELANRRAALEGGDGLPLMLINLGDARHFRVFGADSMFGAVLERLGLDNAWSAPTSYAATAPIGLEHLARVPEAWIVVLPPVPPDAERVLAGSAFWQALPSVRKGRVVMLESVNPFGALPAALRFARLLTESLPAAGEQARG